MSNPNDWLHIYQRNHQQQPIHPTAHHRQGMFGRLPDAPFAATNSASNFSSNSTDQMNLMGRSSNNDDDICNSISNSGSSSSSAHLNPARRVSKPIRRRRASRGGAPVTLLNTDATNFRAMVQQFTGVPNPPFSLCAGDDVYNPRIDGTNLNFPQRRGSWFQHRDTSSGSSVMLLQQQQVQQQQQAQQQQCMFGLNNNHSTVTSTGREGSNHQDQQLLNNPVLPNFES